MGSSVTPWHHCLLYFSGSASGGLFLDPRPLGSGGVPARSSGSRCRHPPLAGGGRRGLPGEGAGGARWEREQKAGRVRRGGEARGEPQPCGGEVRGRGWALGSSLFKRLAEAASSAPTAAQTWRAGPAPSRARPRPRG